MRKILIIMFIVLCLCGCVSYSVEHKEYNSIGNNFTTDTIKVYEDILYTLSFAKVSSIDSEYYSVIIEYVGSGWLFLGGDVTIQADNRIIKIIDNKPYRIVLPGGDVKEIIRATIDKNSLKAIANSSTLRVQFFGSPIEINGEQIEYINRFYIEYVKDE